MRQSLLTFVCSIPNWLLEEITEYVNKNKDHLISEGVIEVTIDSAIIFNVVCEIQPFCILLYFLHEGRRLCRCNFL